MYVSSLSAQTLRMRYSYASEQTDKAKDGQAVAKKEESKKTQESETEKSGSFSDVLSLVSNDQKPVQSVKAYVQETVSKVLERISRHAANAFSQQGSSYSVTVTNINITIELDESESLSDVKSELDSMLSEDGYWGVEKTSQRMFDLARAIAGDDVEQLQKAKEAVSKGFKQAEAVFGGKLPQISYDTYDAAMNKFDNYIDHISSSLSATYA